MGKKTLILDLDGVLRNFWGQLSLVVGNLEKHEIKNPPNKFKISEALEDSGLEPDAAEYYESIIMNSMASVKNTTMFTNDIIQPAYLPGIAIRKFARKFSWTDILWDYLSRSFDVTIATDQPDACHQDTTLLWMWGHLRGFNEHTRVIYTSGKHLLSGDVIIEDNSETIAKFLENNPQAQGFCVKWPYNSESNANIDTCNYFRGDVPNIIEKLDKLLET